MNNIKIENIILTITTIMIFLNLTIYLPFAGFFPFPAYFIDLIIFSSIILFYLKKGFALPYKNPLILWVLYYTILNITYFMASPAGADEFKYLKLFFFFFFMFFSFILLFNLDDNDLRVTRIATAISVPIATIFLGIDYFNPGYFYFGIELMNSVAGRAAATYLNSNLAGGAMILLLILGIDMVPKRFRFFFVLIVFLGIFFTMSRSNIMIMFIILFIMFFQKKLYSSQVFIFMVTITLFFGWLSTGGLDTLSNTYNLEVTENMRNRVDFFANNKSSDTADMDERKYVLLAAFDMYTNSPILGNGYASTRLWDFPVAPHNTFIMHWADYGILGILLIPLLLYFATYNIYKYGKKLHKELAFLIMTYFILASFFSHNMLESPFRIAAIIILSALGLKAKELDYERKNEKLSY